MPYILERHVLSNQQPRNQQRFSGIPRPAKQLHLSSNNNHKGGISHASKPTTDKLPLATPSKAQLKSKSSIPHEHLRPKIVTPDSDPELAILELIPFGQQPVVNFGQIDLGTTRIMYIMLRNPLAKQQQLFVSSFPKPEKGFNMEATEFLIAPRTEICVALACTPKLAGGFRETITVQDVHRMSKKIILLGSVVRPRREPVLARSVNRRTVPRIYTASPAKCNRVQGPERNNRLFSPKVTVQKTKKDVKPLTKLQYSSPQKRHRIVTSMIARRDPGRIAARAVAALVIQKHYRGLVARREYIAKKNAAICIQRSYKSVCARRRFVALRSAAIVFQKHYRGLVARRERARLARLHLELIAAREAAALVIQKHYRGLVARREYIAKKNAAICIQRSYKSVCARRRFVALRSAAIVFQKHYRGLVARRERARLTRLLLERIAARKAAALVIQKHYRCLVARREYIAKKNAAICIQRSYKSVCARRRFVALRSAAIVFQKHYRGLVARRERARLTRLLLERIAARKAAALVIQKHYRCLVARREYIAKKNAAICIQRSYKSVCARRRFVALRSAVIVFQKHYRGLVARRERARLARLHLELIAAREAAALVIQKHYRGLVARREYTARRNAAICIQRGYKSVCARRRFVALRSAAIVFQKHYRGLVARRERARLTNLLLLLQARVRGFLRRSRLRRSIQAIENINRRAMRQH